MFKLGFFKVFIAVSLGAILLMAAFSQFFLAPTFTRVIVANRESQAVRVATHLSKMFLGHSEVALKAMTRETLPLNFELEINTVENDFNLMKVKLYDPSGKTIYSTDPQEVGQTNPSDIFQKVLAQGRPFSHVALKNTLSLEGQALPVDVVEAYVPIAHNDRLLGAFEIYFDITATKAQLDRMLWRLNLISLGVTLAMLALVVFFSLKAMRSIIGQAEAKARDIENAHQRLLTVLDSLDTGVYVSDLETNEILFLNKTLRNTFGDVTGKTCCEVFHPDTEGTCQHCSRVDRLLEQVPDDTINAVNICELFNPDDRKWYEIRERPIRWVDGRTVRLEIATDITARKGTEIELRTAHQEMGQFCRIIKQVSAETTLDGIGRCLGRELGDILGTDRLRLFVLSGDHGSVHLLSAAETATIKNQKLVQGVATAIERTAQTVIDPPRGLVPNDFKEAAHQILIPFHLQGHPNGLLLCAFETKEPPVDEMKLQVAELILEQVAGTLHRAILHHDEVRQLEGRLESVAEFSGIIGKDPKMQVIYKLIEDIADTEATVLILGETGTGKEVVARAIHSESQRADNPFVVVNCAAYPATLLESELFGHEKGAFTGAIRKKIGRFEQAHGGTVLLDEIGEISASAQIKLLRVIQTHKFERLGGEQTIAVNVRILAATNKDLLQEVKNGNFREDLFYRLNVIPIELPPLRARRNDIPLLARHFQRKFTAESGSPVSDFSAEAMRLLLDYGWPGNVRELENSVEHAVVLSKGKRIEVSHLPSIMVNEEVKQVRRTITGNEKRLLLDVLEECNWNKSQAAQNLGISRSSLYSKLKKFKITKPGR